MKNKSTNTALPTIRFPEFRKAGEWKIGELGNLASFLKGKNLSKKELSPNGSHPCIHYGELFTIYSEVINSINSRTNLKKNSLFSLKDDVLMPSSDVTPRGLAKACCIKINNVILGGDIIVIRAKSTKICGEFLSREIRRYENKVLKLVSGSTVFHLYPSSLEKLNLPFPSITEQQKIADCLTSIDKLIAAQEQIITTLQKHKKGLMQQMFPESDEVLG